MSRTIRLHDIAHARAGDKGNTSNISVWVYDPGDYALVKEQLTPERVKAAFPDLVRGRVVRYELEHLHGLNFVRTMRSRAGSTPRSTSTATASPGAICCCSSQSRSPTTEPARSALAQRGRHPPVERLAPT